MKIKISITIVLSMILIIAACKTSKFSERVLKESEQQLTSLRTISIKENKIPRTIEKDVSSLGLYVTGGSTQYDMLSIFNNSLTPQNWRVTNIEFKLIDSSSKKG
jgi:hypothetical protein